MISSKGRHAVAKHQCLGGHLRELMEVAWIYTFARMPGTRRGQSVQRRHGFFELGTGCIQGAPRGIQTRGMSAVRTLHPGIMSRHGRISTPRRRRSAADPHGVRTSGCES